MTDEQRAHISPDLLAPGAIKKILVCQLRQIGDVLLATPSVELLHDRFPDAQIHFFTEKKCASLLYNHPFIHTIWEIDKKQLPTLLHELLFYNKVAANGFDIVVDFQQLPRCRWVVGLSRAKIRLTFPPPWYNRLLYTHWINQRPNYSGAFKADVLRALGITWQGQRPRLFLTENEKRDAAAHLYQWGAATTSPDFFISIDATHRHATRRWPATSYAALIDGISEAYPHARFLLPFGPGEEEEIRQLRELCACKSKVIVPPFMLTLRQLGACMSFARLHIGNCSAPRHMAVALDVPSFTLLGATNQAWTFPSPEHKDIHMKLPCQPCNKNACSIGIKCLTELSPAQVLPEVLHHMQQCIQE